MSQFKIVTKVETINSRGVKEDLSVTKTETSLTDVVWKNIEIASGERKFIFDPVNWTDYIPTSFASLFMLADGTLDVEMTINEGDANEEFNSFRLTKNDPQFLGSDVAYYNHGSTTDGVYAGTLDVIDRIRVDEPTSAGAVNLLLIIGV